MLSIIRKYSGSWMTKFILIAVAVTFFGGWGILSMFHRGCGREDIVAKVESKIITQADLNKYYENLKKQYRDRLGSQFTEELAAKMQLKQQALNMLINRELLFQEARRLHITVTDTELWEHISRIPGFQDSDGKFNRARYEQILRLNNITPEEYEENQRLLLLGAKFEHLIEDGVRITEDEIRNDFFRRNERAKIAYIQIGPTDASHRISVTREEIEKYYHEHQDQFLDPAKRRVAYIVLDPENYRNQLPENLETEVLLDKTNRLAWEEAQEIHRSIQPGESLLQVGQRRKIPVRVTSLVSNLDPIDGSSELTTRAFSLSPHEVSGIIYAGGKYYLLEVTEVIPPKPKPLNIVAEEIKEKIKNDKGKTEAQNFAADALELLRQTKKLESVARRYGLKIQTTDFFSRMDDSIPGIGKAPDIFESAFSLSLEQPVAEKLFPHNGNYYLIVLKEREKADINKYRQEREKIRQQLLTLKKGIASQGYLLTLREKADLKIDFKKLE